MTTAFPARNRSALVLQALRILGAVSVGQSADADDKDRVDDYVEPLLARLDAESITTIADPNQVPAAQFMDVAVLLAEMAMQEFGLSALPPPNDPRMSEVRLRTVVSIGPTMETVETTDPDTGETVEYERPQTLQGEYY